MMKKEKLEQGQSFVEMAISLVFFLIVVLGMLDVARVFYIYIALQDSAETGAVYLAQHPACPLSTSGTACTGTNNADYRAKHASGAQINWATVTVKPDFINATASSQAMVKITMTYDFKLLTPVISNIVGSDTIKLTVNATHVRMVN